MSLKQTETMTQEEMQRVAAAGPESAVSAVSATSAEVADAAAPAPDDDPMPEPPDPLDPNACCYSGCEWCVLDLHAEDEARYRSALAAWQQRQGQK